MTAPGRWLPVLAWMGLLWTSSARPAGCGPELRGWDKLAHAGAYAALASLVYRALPSGPAAVALAAGYGVVDELHQSRVPGRSPDPLDWVADLLGALAGASLAVRWTRRRPTQLSTADRSVR